MCRRTTNAFSTGSDSARSPERSAKPLGARQSRHFYDLAQLADHPIASEALERLELLNRVAEHKRIYFRVAWAKYIGACPGTLRLAPGIARTQKLATDYKDMQPMFFGDYPSFENILLRLTYLKDAINSFAMNCT
ncbi:nucleotidyl transferase AbiEii/AbiGii toxin family protein [Rubripirellula amarantea]|nr:nucleotidyl transferase AbiEii/AbiGii toxin family protein [Rubripirellula amarantea]